MRTPKLLYAALLVSGVALADAPLDVTIRVLDSPRDLPDAVTKRIELPPRAAEIAGEQAQPGLDRANDARGEDSAPRGRDAVDSGPPQGRVDSGPGAHGRKDSGPRGHGRAAVPPPHGGPPGLDRARQARPQGRDFGHSAAEEARDRGSRGNGVGHRPHGRGRH